VLGQEIFNELKAKSEIVEFSPLYDQLDRLQTRLPAPRSRNTTTRSSFILSTKLNRTLSQLRAATCT